MVMSATIRPSSPPDVCAAACGRKREVRSPACRRRSHRAKSSGLTLSGLLMTFGDCGHRHICEMATSRIIAIESA